MGKELIQFARNEKGVPIGCFVAHGNERIGWSLCSRRDKWNRKLAIEIARGRAKGYSNPVPVSIKNQYDKFVERCHKYYR